MRAAYACLCSLALGWLLAPGASADESLSAASQDFETLCAPCHGINGKGDGPVPKGVTHKPADLTAITAKYGGVFPEDQIFETIAGLDMPDGHGNRDMPIWGDVFVSQNVGDSVKLQDAMRASDDASRHIAALIGYIRTMQAAP